MKKRLLCLLLVISVVAGLFALAPVSAASDMIASDDCLGIIKEFEGFSGTPYRDTDGLYTIGYGTRCPTELVDFYKENPMSTEEAEEELRKAVVTYEKTVNSFIDRHKLTLSQQQFDALVSLVYNVGGSWLTKGNTLINAITGGATGNELIYAFTIYSMSGGNRSVGHIKRRLAEANVYLNGVYSRTLPDNLAYVLYDGCGGEVSSYNVQGYDTDLTAVPMVSATRDGYEFKGWYTAAKGGELVQLLDSNTKNMTLFAQWESLSGELPIEPEQPDEDAPVVPESVVVTVTGDRVNVRRGPGLSYGVVGTVNEGTKLTITEMIESNGYLWGKFKDGWVALEYTDYNDGTSCDHAYAVTNQKAPTCTQSGSVTYTCSGCGDSYTQSKAATGHSYQNATCTAAKKCKTCGAVSGNALGHSYGSDSLCVRCGEVDPNKPCDHQYKLTKTVAATCTAKGSKTYTCSLCDDSYTESIAAKGHSYGRDGLCSHCGAKDPDYKGVSVKVTANKVNIRKGAGLGYQTVGSVNTGVKLTITQTKQKDGYLWGKSEKGWIALKYTNYDKVIAGICEHTYSVTATKDATCTAKGSKTYTCKDCGHSYSEEIAMKAHSYNAATCTVSKTCKVCGAVSGTALGHSYGEATCTSARTCKSCGVTTGSALGHKYGTDGFCDRCNAKDPNYKEPEKPVTITKTYATVIKTDSLNIRNKPDGTVVGSLKKGDRVEILEQKMVAGRNWGRCSKGWICLRSYAKLETVTETTGTTPQPETPKPENPKPEQPNQTVTVVKTYATVIGTDSLNIRVTPDGAVVGSLKKGTKVEILEQKTVNGRLWGRCSKGWICLRSYAKLETVKETVSASQTTQQTGVVTASALNVRAGAGTNHAVVGRLSKGTTVVILEKKTVNGTTWARTAQGWISMAYVK